MKYRLLNAAIMPVEGTYRIRSLTPGQFAEKVLSAYQLELLVSYIGYPNCVSVLEALCRCPIALNRSSTLVEDGDVLLIARLRYRVDNPALKGQVQATVEDYEFFRCDYRSYPS